MRFVGDGDMIDYVFVQCENSVQIKWNEGRTR
jgi:hypothetical protein